MAMPARDARGRFIKGSGAAGQPLMGIVVQVEDHTRRVVQESERAAFRNFSHAAARIRKDAAESIEKSDEPAPPGHPVHTRRGHYKRALRFAASKEDAVIGPRASIVGEVGRAHEHGEEYKGDEFEERPVMGPALRRNLDRFAREWTGSIG